MDERCRYSNFLTILICSQDPHASHPPQAYRDCPTRVMRSFVWTAEWCAPAIITQMAKRNAGLLCREMGLQATGTRCDSSSMASSGGTKQCKIGQSKAQATVHAAVHTCHAQAVADVPHVRPEGKQVMHMMTISIC